MTDPKWPSGDNSSITTPKEKIPPFLNISTINNLNEDEKLLFPSFKKGILLIENKYPYPIGSDMIDKLFEKDNFSKFDKFYNLDISLNFFYDDILLTISVLNKFKSYIEEIKKGGASINNEEEEFIKKRENPLLSKDKIELIKKIKGESNSFDNFVKKVLIKDKINKMKELEKERTLLIDDIRSPIKTSREESMFSKNYLHRSTIGKIIYNNQGGSEKLLKERHYSPLSGFQINMNTVAADYVMTKYYKMLHNSLPLQKPDPDLDTSSICNYICPKIISAIEAIQDEYYKYFENKEKN